MDTEIDKETSIKCDKTEDFEKIDEIDLLSDHKIEKDTIEDENIGITTENILEVEKKETNVDAKEKSTNEKSLKEFKSKELAHKSKDKVEKEHKQTKKEPAPPQKIVIRRLPPTMTAESFLEQVSPLPEYNNFYFVKADKSYSPNNFSRAYINFVHTQDIFNFKDKFDNYVFVDAKGNEYLAVVEFAIFQKIPKRGRYGRKKDNKCGTIESDPAYIKFVEEYNRSRESSEGKPEYSFQIKEETKKNDFISTPLVEYVNHRKQEQNRIREERREERRRREATRRRLKDEERRRKRMAAREMREREQNSKTNDDNSTPIDDNFEKPLEKTESEESITRAQELSNTSAKTDETKERAENFSTNDRQTETLTFTRTRRESFESDRSDRGGNPRQNVYGSGRFERNTKSTSRKFESSYGSRGNESRSGHKPVTKEPYRPRFPQTERGRKDIFAREERFGRDGKDQRRFDRGYKFESSVYKNSYGGKNNCERSTEKKVFENSNRSTASNKYEQKGSWKSTNKDHPDDQKDDENHKSKNDQKMTEKNNDTSSKTKSDDCKSENVTTKERQTDESVSEKMDKDSDEKEKQSPSKDSDQSKSNEHDKDKEDPRKQRRIRNKDRPALQIYRPGMGRFSKERIMQDIDNNSTTKSSAITANDG